MVSWEVGRYEDFAVRDDGDTELVPFVQGVELVPLVAAVPPVAVLLPPGPLSQAATASPAATITAMADSREQLRSKPISFLLRLVKPMATTLRSPAP